MSVEKLTNTNIKSFAPQEKRYTVRDSEVQGLVLRVEPTGRKQFYLDYRERESGRRTSYKIGDATILTITQAREVAKTKLADIIRGLPVVKKKNSAEITVEDLFKLYKEQVLKHHKTANAERFIQVDFSSFLPRPCSTLTGEDLANWRGGEKEKGKKDSSINRAANAFLAMLRWGRENDKIINCPLIKKKIKKLPESDSTEIIRYLSVDERQRLLAALDKREKPRQPDYLRTLVLVALNTGIRRGALLKLTWDDLSFETQTIRLRRETAKSDKLSYIPMNSTVYDTLTKWKTFKEKKGRVEEFLFTGSQGTPLSDIRKSWATVLNEAKITGFRWHDLRHDYASQLVMAGVSILTVKELLTHTNLEQTLRYAHLAPDQKKSAVDKLDSLYK